MQVVSAALAVAIAMFAAVKQDWIRAEFAVALEVAGQPIHFQARGGTIVPFLDMPFEVSKEHQPIQEVALGPRCANSFEAVKYALGNLGYGNIPLKIAGGKYR
ncbi:MAG TPA: hypothetical protein VK602_14595 [Phyllobacterium sp.]|nr:hypothetical protein [Phyllobacterium sp.]